MHSLISAGNEALVEAGVKLEDALLLVVGFRKREISKRFQRPLEASPRSAFPKECSDVDY